MSTETRFRSDSIVSVDETDFQLEDRSVLSEDVVFALQSDDVASLRLVGAAELRKPTTAKTYALHEACEHGAFDAVKFLVGELAHDVDARDEQHWTPLHYAAAFGGAPELVHYLLAAGADPSARDSEGRSCLWAACATQNVDVAAALLDGGAQIDAPDAKGTSPLQHATASGFAEVIALLASRGASDDDKGRLSM